MSAVAFVLSFIGSCLGILANCSIIVLVILTKQVSSWARTLRKVSHHFLFIMELTSQSRTKYQVDLRDYEAFWKWITGHGRDLSEFDTAFLLKYHLFYFINFNNSPCSVQETAEINIHQKGFTKIFHSKTFILFLSKLQNFAVYRYENFYWDFSEKY